MYAESVRRVRVLARTRKYFSPRPDIPGGEFMRAKSSRYKNIRTRGPP